MSDDYNTFVNDDFYTEQRSLSKLEQQLHKSRLRLGRDGFVRWASDNPDHPRNWSWQRKAYDTSVIIFLDLFTTAISTAGSSSAVNARSEFGISRTTSLFAFTSTYLLGQGIGGIVFPPYSETFGRKPLYLVSTLLYCLACLGVAVFPSLASVLAGRLFTGFLSAIPTIVVAGSIEDIYNTDTRIWMIYLWALVANLGLVLGPIMGAHIAHYLTWQWLFYVAAIVMAVVFVLTACLRESRPSKLLEEKVQQVREETGYTLIRTNNPDHVPDFRTFIQLALSRPLFLLFTEPIVFTISVMSGIAFAIFYLFSEALGVVYGAFDLSERQSSLAFIPIGIGLFFGVLPRLYDRKVIMKLRRQGRPVDPEDKLFGFVIAVPILAISLWIFAWTVPPFLTGVHWIVSMMTLVPIGFAANELDCTLAGYLADSYTIYAASAFAAMSLVRSILCAALPLFTHDVYVEVGANIGSSLLAILATIFCIAPVVFVRYGKRLRESSEFAKYSLRVYKDNAVDEAEGVAEDVGDDDDDDDDDMIKTTAETSSERDSLLARS